MDGLAIAASVTEIRRAVEGGFLDAIYQPTRSAFVLRVSGAERVRILLSPRAAEIHLTGLALPNPPTPSPFVMLLRRHLRGGRIAAVRQHGWDRAVTFEVERRDGRRTRPYELVAELTGVRGNLHLLDGGSIVGSSRRDRRNRPGDTYVALRPQGKLDPTRLTEEELGEALGDVPDARALVRCVDGVGRSTAEDILSTSGQDGQVGAVVISALRGILAHVERPSPYVIAEADRATFYPPPAAAEPAATFGAALDVVSDAASERGEPEERPTRATLSRRIARHRRTIEKLAEWLDGAAEAERLQSLGDLVMIHHTEIPPKAEEAVLTDPASDRDVTVRLAPSLTAIENAQRLYERAKRLRRGRPHVAARLERLRSELRALEEALADDDAGRPAEEPAGSLPTGQPARPPAPAPRRQRIDVEGFTILVGRSARDNDRLLREAAPDDLWLHVKGFAGAHVIIRRGGRREIPESVVRRAAGLAAEHSKATGERRVEVLMAEAKRVRKPKGAPDGLANVTGGATLTVEL